ncbi:MAG: hypothetical protein K6U14_06535 [Firmicutes bacterium]|nr:hypothetical protein [Alicyclobacillaceae bacterium]MCL6497277.1 hypothetical protein [Bacillota bacterium]
MLYPPLPLPEMLQVFSFHNPLTVAWAAVAAAILVFFGGFITGMVLGQPEEAVADAASELKAERHSA